MTDPVSLYALLQIAVVAVPVIVGVIAWAAER